MVKAENPYGSPQKGRGPPFFGEREEGRGGGIGGFCLKRKKVGVCLKEVGKKRERRLVEKI